MDDAEYKQIKHERRMARKQAAEAAKAAEREKEEAERRKMQEGLPCFRYARS